MPKLSRNRRTVEAAAQRLIRDRRQAVGLRKKIESRLTQIAAKLARPAALSRQAPVDAIIGLRNDLLKSGRVGWVKISGKNVAVLVERGTGCVITDSRRGPIFVHGFKLSPTPAISQAVFLRHLKSTFVENFVPYMYRDSQGNVTVGIGQLLPTIADAQALTFTKRGTNIKATPQEIKNDFNNVKNARLPLNTAWPAYQKLTRLQYSEQRADLFAIGYMNKTLAIIKGPSYFQTSIAILSSRRWDY